MYKLIEITTILGTQYTVELVNFNENKSNAVSCKLYFNVSDNQLTLKTTFKGTFKTVKKLLNNYIKSEIPPLLKITEY